MSSGALSKIPLMRPQLPTFDALEPYLREIDETRWYSNFGPLVTRFEERLAQHYSLPKTAAAVVANGTTALSATLLAVGAKPGTKCLVPSWTFVASAAAICAANLEPLAHEFVSVMLGARRAAVSGAAMKLQDADIITHRRAA